MQYVDLIIKIAGGITAVLGIWRAVVFFVHLADDIKETKEIVKENLPNVKEIPDIKRHCYENYLSGLRLTVMSNEMPLGERIIAGQKYIDEGGNGEVKKFINEELNANKPQHK
ncbi:MAG: hypothetical protein IJZ16_01165 [Clostridia bacterium]|nr:hypothetical protein [Clostridia bacterium]